MRVLLRVKKSISILLTLVLFALVLGPAVPAKAAITGNDSIANAYIHGLWSNSNIDTTIIEPYQEAAYYKFTVNAGDRIYARVTYSTDKAGMSVDLLNAGGTKIDGTSQIHDSGTVLAFMAINCNGTGSGQTFYLRINRGTVDETKAMYVSYTFYDRIKSGSKAFDFTGTASNPGNNPYIPAGVDSSILKLNLTNSTQIPAFAVVKSANTSAVQSPSQGGVKHKIMPSNSGTWFTALATSATSGSYGISLSNAIAAKQEWQFRYNATAGGASTMKNVKLTLNWEYDISNTDYKLFTP